ncbi:porin [Limnohabitans sp.]|uniref:porin n=1 Tax=Limnohabitans sp. TaxID=1907725 RepID=UPI00286F4705|nr:porin [Limnohabitans sp.]
MKKTLVAIAALTAVSAFAQSSVVIDGYFDRAFTSVNNTNNNLDAKSVGSNAGTTTVGIKAREDLGGGLSVGGSVNTDWADLGGAQQKDAIGTAQRGGFANSQSFVDVTDAKLGTLRLGAPNSFTLTNATAVAQPGFSTAIGSAYSSNFSTVNGLGTGKTDNGGIVNASSDIKNSAATAQAGVTAGQRAIRIANTVQYSSPAMYGVTAHVGFTPKNNNDTGAGTAATFNTSSATANTAVKAYGNTVGVTEYALRYTQGPVDAMYTSIKYSVGNNIIGAGGSVATTALAANLTNTQNLLGATYTVMPSLKLHAGFGNFSSSNDAYKGKSTQYGATYTTGAWDIAGQMAKVDDQSTNDADRKMTGLGVNYNLSKTARVYARYDNINYASNKAAFEGSAQKRTAIGVSKSF